MVKFEDHDGAIRLGVLLRYTGDIARIQCGYEYRDIPKHKTQVVKVKFAKEEPEKLPLKTRIYDGLRNVFPDIISAGIGWFFIVPFMILGGMINTGQEWNFHDHVILTSVFTYGGIYLLVKVGRIIDYLGDNYG